VTGSALQELRGITSFCRIPTWEMKEDNKFIPK